MTKAELDKRMSDYKSVTHDALKLIWDNTNKGQRNKLLKTQKSRHCSTDTECSTMDDDDKSLSGLLSEE